MREFSVRIEGRPPTPNARRHWRQTAHDNETWKRLAYFTAAGAWSRDQKPLQAVEMDVLFIVSTQGRRDWDNLIASIKPCLDGIVAAGVIADDSTSVITAIRFACEYRKGETATIYSIRGEA